MVIPREPRRITYSSEIRALKNKAFSSGQKSIIEGSLLGDGSLQASWSGKSYRFASMHSIKQKEYIDWMYEKLKPFVLSMPWFYAPKRSLRIRTISHLELTEMHGNFYRDKVKVLPANIAEIIRDPLALAVWFMDDGNLVASGGYRHGYHLNTQGFSEDENRVIQKLFKTIWNFDCSLQKNNGKHRIYIGSASRDAFAKTVRSHLLPSMQYKLG
ncbi:MAG TPA: LAGLIDADG endonuclease [Candidatus Paceibacterota bacterium]